jgi:cell wall-associated NlpC family hydrolase
MGPVVAQVAVALGLDGVVRWVIVLVTGLVVLCLLVVLIVAGSVATIVTGGQASPSPAAASISAVQPVLPTPGPAAPQIPGTDLGDRIVQLAQAWLGIPYLFGGCSRTGVDCSCLVQNVYAAVAIHLPRVAVDQFNATVAVTDPQPGDLVFFANTYEPGISHVGIYIGNGLQINAPTTGQVVSVASVFTGYWGNHYAGARRVRV